MTEQNLKRIRQYENKKRILDSLPAEYPKPLMNFKSYKAWQEKYHGRFLAPKLNLLKLIIP